VVLYDAAGITADIETSSSDIVSSVSGKLDTIKMDQIGKISLTPCGEISDDIIEALFPHQNPVIGASIFGASDTELSILSKAGTQVTFHAAALTKCPDLILSPVKTAFSGSAEFTALVAKGKAPGDAGGLYTVGSGTYAGYPDTPPTGRLYTGTWGSFSIADTIEGWTVSVEISVSPISVDSVGTIDMVLTGVTVRAKCRPVGPTEAIILAALPALTARGQSLKTANDLVIAAPSPGLAVTLKNASLMTGPLAWGSTELRIGEIGFLAHRAFAAGTPGDLYTIAAAVA
jgi:hypothetical protein